MGRYRLLLAILVIVVHSRGYWFAGLPDTGLAAVGAFFFISGFLMPRAFARNYRYESTSQQVAAYALNRVLRIFPLYWISITLMFAILAAGNFEKFFTLASDPSYVIKQYLLIGLNLAELWGDDRRLNGPAWTLDIELQYYFLCPFLVLAWHKTPRLVVAGIALVATIGAFIQMRNTGIVAIDRSLLSWSPLFGLGFIASMYPTWAQRLCTTGATLVLLAAFSAILLPAASFPTASTWILMLLLVAISCRLLLQQRQESSFDKYCGDLSYPVYIFHTIVPSLAPWSDTLIQWAPAFVVNLTSALVIAAVVEAIFGKAVNRLRGRLRKTHQTGGRPENRDLQSPALAATGSNTG